MQDSLEGIRLSPQQKRLWLLQGNGPAYYAHARVLLNGPVDTVLLEDAIECVVARHEMFRTTFHREPGVRIPFQVIGEHLAPQWCTVDWREHGPSDQEAELKILSDEQRRLAFDFERGPLLDVVLVLCAEHRSVLLMCLPVLCADGRTLHNLVQEICRIYGAGLEGKEPAEEPTQYVQFSEWQHELLADEEAEKGAQYWQRVHLAAPPAVILPCEQSASRTADSDTGRFFSATGCLDADVVAKLNEMALAHATSLMVVLLACWQALLFRLTGQEDVVVATLADGRKYEELYGTMGPLAQWLPIRCRAGAALRFSDLVSQARAVLGEALDWQEYCTWEEDRADGQTASADPVGFEYHVLPTPWRAAELSFLLVEQAVRFGRWKLTLSCIKRDSELAVHIHYDAKRFRTDYVHCLVTQFTALVKSIAGDPQAAVEELDMLDDAERRRLLSLTDDTRFDDSSDECLHHLFELSAKQDPQALAVVCGDERITYAELNVKANQLAHALMRRGVGPDVLVALCVERSAAMLIGVLGILKAGGAYVPLDPGNSRARLAYEIAHSGAPVIVTQEHLLPLLPDLDGIVLCLDRDIALLDREVHTDPGRTVSPQHLAYVIYTSGSTGVPKGVAITHQSAVNYTRDICRRLGVERGWHFATVSTIGADLGNTVIFASWGSGGCLHVIQYKTATEGGLFADYVAQHAIDVLKIVPSHLNALLTSCDEKDILPSKYLILGGEALSIELADRLSRRSPCGVINHYGPTETTIGSLTYAWGRERQGLGSSSTVPIGRPIANVDVYVLDGQLRPVPIGVPGELYIGGMGMARGYLRSPEQTAERFVPHPFSTVSGRRLYKTGDLVRYWPDGAIEYLGRLDDQVKIRGYRVELGEIEARLREHPRIREAVVTAHDDGSGGKRVVAYVVRRDAGQFDMAAIRHFLKERLPEYMVPSACVFLAALPLTSNGKVDRKALPPPDAPGHARNRYIAPRTSVEKILAEIWTDLLTAPSIGVEDNFFDLGGHSLLAIQLMHRIQKCLGVSLSLTAVFEAPTLAGLSERVEQGRAGASPLVPLRASGSRPPLYCLDPTGSHVSAYQELAEGLNLDRPVYGLELRPSVAAQDALVLTIAQEQAAAIRSHQPNGPYHLLGWSLGGVFAVAVAHALERQGQSVGFLGILDTQARLQTYGTEEDQDPLAELAEYVHLDRRHDVLSISEQDRLALLNQLAEAGKDDRPEVVIRWAQTRGLLAGEIPAEALKLRYFLLRNAAHFMKTRLAPLLRAPIHVWWTSDTLQRYGEIPIVWECYTSSGIHAAVIDGDHMEVVKNPHVIAKIDEYLTSLDG